MTQTTTPTSFKFRFKKDEIGNQREAVEILTTVENLAGVRAILDLPTSAAEAGSEEAAVFNRNQQDLILEAMSTVYRGVIGDWVAADPANTAAAFKADAYTWAAIANMSKEDRRSSSIAKEVWDAFAQDYATVMAAVAGRTTAQLESAIAVFQKKFSIIKTNKPAIEFLRKQLALYVEHTKQGEQFVEIIELLTKKSKDLLEDKSAESLVGNLGM
jgi:hypothetical protein